MRRILKILTNNLGLKIISIVLAFILWLVVVNINNPKTTVTFTAMATIENSDVITDNGKVYDILDDSNLVTFTVSGPRTTVESMSASDFEVVADMNKIDLDLGFVPIDVTPLKHASQITIEKKTTNLKVAIENLAKEQFVIAAAATGTPKDGYAQGEVSVDPNMVSISGPESVVSKVAKVVATVNVDGASGERTQKVVPVVYDDDGNVIDSDKMNILPGTVEVKANILLTKEVPIKVESTGTPKSGYVLTEVKCSPETIVVKGSKDNLSQISSITIPAAEIDVEGISKSIEKKLDITQYLPEGIQLFDKDLTNVVVTATITPMTNRTITLDPSDIIVKNVPDGYNVEFDESVIKIIISGLSEAVTDVTASSLNPVIDLQNETNTTFRVMLALTMPDGVTQFEDVYVKGKLVPIDTSDTGDEDNTGQ